MKSKDRRVEESKGEKEREGNETWLETLRLERNDT